MMKSTSVPFSADCSNSESTTLSLLPRMTGLEFLEALRADPSLSKSIVFILTSSNADEDKAAAYKHHIAGYVVKSDAGVSFLKAVQMVQKYVLCVQFPPPEHG